LGWKDIVIELFDLSCYLHLDKSIDFEYTHMFVLSDKLYKKNRKERKYKTTLPRLTSIKCPKVFILYICTKDKSFEKRELNKVLPPSKSNLPL
jgi:hypothetical protein